MFDPDGLDANMGCLNRLSDRLVGSPREAQGVRAPGFVLTDSKIGRAIMPGFPIQRH